MVMQHLFSVNRRERTENNRESELVGEVDSKKERERVRESGADSWLVFLRLSQRG